ncbi:metallophosphoesterase [Brackiella oedipodis]|uniref:metallophosphoesterase n=1 Tax=Brackiella oedipodis TaxID=124225 RepID=UPI0006860DB7|nr:metallophosphoesterase [Brackiella oedipodis]
MRLIQALPEGPLDIVGDIHGEYQALLNLLQQLGYDKDGKHAQQRTLVFIGDMFDRGPQCPQVFEHIRHLIDQGHAQAILGNHELNVLRHDPKDGTGWFFEQRVQSDTPKYAPFERASAAQRQAINEWLNQRPIALEREDLRIVHAAWIPKAIEALRDEPIGQIVSVYDQWMKVVEQKQNEPDLLARLQQEKKDWPHSIEDITVTPPYSPARAQTQVLKQSMNPINSCLSGLEAEIQTPFYVSGKWRFTDRLAWWDHYDDKVPVLIGHYWRHCRPVPPTPFNRKTRDIFKGISPFAWHGKHHNVFCIDYSVGGRWIERKENWPLGSYFRLAAMQWPEKRLVFEDGVVIDTHPQQAKAEESIG